MNRLIRWSALVATVLMAGCASNPKPEPVHEQGWIGGRYKCAKSGFTVSDWVFGIDDTIDCLPPELQYTQKSAILAVKLSTNSPAFRAGLREGDLILELSHKPVTDLPAFWKSVRLTPPGASLAVKVYRDAQTVNFDVIIGREKYRDQRTFMVGLPGFWQPPHPIPTHNAPAFSLVALGCEREGDSQFDFDSVEQRYRRICHPKDKQEGSDEDWKCWLTIFQVTKGKTIIAQDPLSGNQTASTTR